MDYHCIIFKSFMNNPNRPPSILPPNIVVYNVLFELTLLTFCNTILLEELATVLLSVPRSFFVH